MDIALAANAAPPLLPCRTKRLQVKGKDYKAAAIKKSMPGFKPGMLFCYG